MIIKNKVIKLLVTDVDGTLLDSNSSLPVLNKKAILACKNSGIEVILATGKSIDSITHIINLLDLKLPQITFNGAVIVNSERKIIRSVKIRPDLYFEVIQTIKEKGYEPLISIENGKIFYESYHPNMENIVRVGEKLLKVDNLETPHFSRNCVSISVPIKETDPLDRFLRDRFSGRLQILRSGEYFFDILSLDAGKGNALLYLARILGVRKEEIVVFGDSYNDLSMFREAGLRIAVKNSYPGVLKEADIITEENYNCGLAKAIFRYVLDSEPVKP
ncbi:MAG: HAD family phosphatase [Actinobacteria bacterium]|nr:HAD family phosphatase [Actinomycetota bacterium]